MPRMRSSIRAVIAVACFACSAMAEGPSLLGTGLGTPVTSTHSSDLPAVPAVPASMSSMPVTVVPDAPLFSSSPSSTLLSSDPNAACESCRPKRFEFFPQSLLWEPKLADRRDPRLGFTFSNVDSFFSRQTADPAIGTTMPIVRWQSQWLQGLEQQVDLFAHVNARFSRADFLIADDYRAGVLYTARLGEWSTKFGWEHTSTHMGDEYIAQGNPKPTPITFERDEMVGALGYLWRNQLRLYGQVAWAFYRDIPGDPDRFRYDIGLDWYRRVTTGSNGQPFAAMNICFDPAVNNEATFNYQVGWMWRTDNKRLSQFRVYAEFFDGRSIFGQLFRNREQYAGFGMALDY